MKPSQIAQILLRLFALTWFVHGVIQIIVGGGLFNGIWMTILPGLIILMMGAILWKIAPGLGKRIAEGDDQEIALPGLSFYQLLTAMFIGLGIYFCLSSAGVIFNWAYVSVALRSDASFIMSHPTGKSGELSYPLMNATVTFIAGLFLIFTARKWACKIAVSPNPELSENSGGNPSRND